MPDKSTDEIQDAGTTPQGVVPSNSVWSQLLHANELSLAPVLTIVLPLLILFLTLYASWEWRNGYEFEAPKPINVVFIEDKNGTMGVETARDALQNLTPIERTPTLLGNNSFWFTVRPSTEQQLHWFDNNSMFLQVRRALETACWDPSDLSLIGTFTPVNTAGGFHRRMAGVVVDSQSENTPPSLLCQTIVEGPGEIIAEMWETDALNTATTRWHRLRGMLDGGLGLLACFLVALGLLRNHRIYLLLAIWLVINIRITELSLDMDFQWFGNWVPDAWLTPMRLITLALYGAVTLLLFLDLFKLASVENRAAKFARTLQIVIWPLLAMALFAPVPVYVLFVWTLGALLFFTLITAIIQAFIKEKSLPIFGYGAIMVVAISGPLYEIVRTAFNLSNDLPLLNAANAALGAGLTATVVVVERFRAEQQRITQSEEAMKHAYNTLPIGLFSMTNDGRILNANPRFLAETHKESATNLHFGEAFGHDAWQYLQAMFSVDEKIEFEFDADMSPDGDRKPESIRSFLIKASKDAGMIEGTVQDVTERRRATVKLEYLARHEPLTGLLNRNAIFEVYQEHANAGKRSSVAFIDVDRFQLVNTLYGHTNGDILLRALAIRIRKAIEPGMSLGRIGGDQFALVMPGIDLETARQVVKRVMDFVGVDQFHVGPHHLNVTCSIGLAEFAAETTFSEAISETESACRQAKLDPQRRVVSYGRDELAYGIHRAEMATVKLLTSGNIELDSLYLEAQPILALNDPQASLNFEFLLRMRDDRGMLVPTHRVLSAAKACGRMAVIDRWVVATALAWIDDHVAQMPNLGFVSLNISDVSINDESFAEDFVTLLEQYDHITKHLCIEFSESLSLLDTMATRTHLFRAKALGVRLAIDDFGAGTSTLAKLSDLPADFIKLDGQFLNKLTADAEKSAMVDALVALARGLKMKSMTKWTENANSLETLRQKGVDYVQGHAIAAAMPLDRIVQYASSGAFLKDADNLSAQTKP